MPVWEAWEAHASEWIEWARRPNHDGFWDGTWPELQASLPLPAELTLEIGCGEGRFSRELERIGHRVVAVERSPALAHAARWHDCPARVALADAGHLPVRDKAVDLLVSCMSLHDIDDIEAMLGEARRVLRDGGAFSIAMLHPFTTAHDPETLYRPEAPPTAQYLEERQFEQRSVRDGLAMTFTSIHRPLGTYIRAFVRWGFVLEHLDETGSTPIPWRLTVRLRKVESTMQDGSR